jgi:hypothetical protein
LEFVGGSGDDDFAGLDDFDEDDDDEGPLWN